MTVDVPTQLRELAEVGSLSFQRSADSPVRTEFPKLAARLLAKREAHDAAIQSFAEKLTLISDGIEVDVKTASDGVVDALEEVGGFLHPYCQFTIKLLPVLFIMTYDLLVEEVRCFQNSVDAFFVDDEDQVVPFQHVTRIWAPDAIVDKLTGPFAEYSTLASIPRAMRAAPDATTWAGVQLWMHWSDPEMDAAEKRVLCRSRQQMVWTVMHVAERLEILPSEMWMLIFTFVKHDQPPTC